MNYLSLSISEIHELILKGEVSPFELVKQAIELAKLDINNAFEYISEKEAISKVKNLDKSKINSVFYGIPVVVKDNYSTKDIPTTASSNILNGYIPVFSSEVVNRLLDAGAIIIGKTTLDELAMGGGGDTGHKGKTFNPWDFSHEHIIGGSSCGSAAAVCAGIVPFALGSDTGDSVRKPASYAGLVGFKPTWGRISRYGLFSFASSLDHVAYFTRNVFDSALALNLLAGNDEKDFTSSFKDVEDYTKDIDQPIKGKRIAVINQIVGCIQNDKVVTTFNNLINKLENKGATIIHIDMDINLLKSIMTTYYVISCAEAMSNNENLDGIKFGNHKEGKTYEEMVIKARTEGFSRPIKGKFIFGRIVSEHQKEYLLKAQKCRRVIVDAFNNIFEKYEAIICPASSSSAPKFLPSNLDFFSDEYLIADNYLAFANLGGYPSITLPLGFYNKLPFGVNITCKPFEESKLLNIAKYVEDSTGLKDLSINAEHERI